MDWIGSEKKGREGGGHTRRSAKPQQRPRRNGLIRRGHQRPPDLDRRGRGFDNGPDGAAAVGREEVARAVDLAVVVVRRAGPAEAPARGQHGRIREEDADGVVVARHGLGRDRGEGRGRGVPQFGLQLAAVVGEGDAVFLAAGDEDRSRGEDDGVGEDAGVGHWADGLDGGGGHRGADRDDVGVCCRVGALLWGM